MVALLVGCQASRSDDSSSAEDLPVDEQLEIEYLAHAAFILRSPGGIELLIDPYASRIWLGYDFPAGIEPDAILVTHPHYDHDAGRYRGAPFPWGLDVVLVDAPGVLEVGDVTVTGVEGRHADPYGQEFGQLNTMMVMEIAGIRVVHLGDNGPLTEEMVSAIGRADVLMMPADAEYHILSEEDTEAILTALDPRIVIPMHYRLPDLETDPDSPSDLGGIEPWLVGRENVRRLGSHTISMAASDLPNETTIWVFEHAPFVTPPR